MNVPESLKKSQKFCNQNEHFEAEVVVQNPLKTKFLGSKIIKMVIAAC